MQQPDRSRPAGAQGTDQVVVDSLPQKHAHGPADGSKDRPIGG